MAVVSVEEIHEERTITENSKGTEVSRSFRVVTDSFATEQAEVMAHASIPMYGSVYNVNGFTIAGCFLTERKASHDQDDPRLWRVTVKYSTLDPDKNLDPLDRPTKCDYKTGWIEEHVAADLDGEKYLNSAYEPLEAITQRIPVLVITARKNFADFDPATDWESWVNTYNNASFTLDGITYDEGTVLLDDVSATDQDEDGEEFKERTYTFKVRSDREDPWLSHYLDQGFATLNLDELRQQTVYTMDGQPPQKPLLLNGTGQLLDVLADDPVYLTFRQRESRDFDDLGL